MTRKINIGDFVIVNHFDRPWSRHIARVTKVTGNSVSAKYVNLNRTPEMDGLRHATLVSDFGCDVVERDGSFVAVPNGSPSIATYYYGTPRQWQEEV